MEAERVFGQQTGFAVEADVVADILHGKAGHLSGAGRASRGVEEFRLKIDVLGAITGRIGVGDVRRHQLLPGAQPVHVSLELSGDGLQHGTGSCADGSPNGKSPEISMMEEITAANFWRGGEFLAAAVTIGHSTGPSGAIRGTRPTRRAPDRDRRTGCAAAGWTICTAKPAQSRGMGETRDRQQTDGRGQTSYADSAFFDRRKPDSNRARPICGKLLQNIFLWICFSRIGSPPAGERLPLK
jgi:hypothetical protein